MDIAGGLAGGTMMTVASQTLLAATGRTMSDSPSAIIIGAGPAGIAMAHELKHKLAFQDFTVYEKQDVVGGVWANSGYPRSGRNAPTLLYNFSFNLNPDWSRDLCEPEEVLKYINATVDKFELRAHIHTSVELVKAQWQEKTNSWSLTLKDLLTGIVFTRSATIIILATGPMGEPHATKTRGADKFQGYLCDSAQYASSREKDASMESGRSSRIAVIGSGFSTTQLIRELVKEATSVKQYTRSPQQYRERSNHSTWSFTRTLYRYLPLYQRLYRLWLFLEREYPVKKDPPSAGLTNAQAEVEDHAENLEVVFEEIREITETGITTTNDVHDDFDTIILSDTAYVPEDPVIPEIIGSLDIPLSRYWHETRGAQAYWGSLVSGFPNFGILGGPNTVPAHDLGLFTCKISVAYLSRVLVAPILDNRAATVAVRQAVEDRWNQFLQARLKREAGAGSENSNEYGRDVARWPGRASNYWWQTWLRGGEGVVYKGGGGAWWINMVVRWARAVRMRTWLALLLFAVSLRVRAIRARVDREVGRYKPIERQVEAYLAPFSPLRDGVAKIIFDS